MRTFLAVFPPPATQAVAHGVIERLRRPGDGVSWVKRDNLHYTLRFLGEIGDDGLRRVSEVAREAAAGVPAFEAVLGTAGAFPSPRRARVLWLGLERGGPQLVELAKRLERALARRGFEPEGRAFTAHLTIGRPRAQGPDWTEALARAGPAGGAAGREFRVESLAVVRSQLDPAGSIYTVVVSAALAAAPAPG